MEWFIAVVVIVALGIAAVAAAGGLGEMKREPIRDDYRQDLPTDRSLQRSDVNGLRFRTAWRGYEMGQVDDVLDRLAAEIGDRDALIAQLRLRLGDTDPVLAPDPVSVEVASGQPGAIAPASMRPTGPIDPAASAQPEFPTAPLDAEPPVPRSVAAERDPDLR